MLKILFSKQIYYFFRSFVNFHVIVSIYIIVKLLFYEIIFRMSSFEIMESIFFVDKKSFFENSKLLQSFKTI